MSAPAARSFRLIRHGTASILRGVLVAVALTGAARAQSAGDGPTFDGLMERFGLKSRPAAAPDFVETARPAPDSLHYIPVGPPKSDAPAVRTMTPAEVAATTEALDQARVRQQRGAGLRPAPAPLKPVAAKGARKATLP